MEFAILSYSLSPITYNIADRLDFDCICHVILIRKGQPPLAQSLYQKAFGRPIIVSSQSIMCNLVLQLPLLTRSSNGVIIAYLLKMHQSWLLPHT